MHLATATTSAISNQEMTSVYSWTTTYMTTAATMNDVHTMRDIINNIGMKQLYVISASIDHFNRIFLTQIYLQPLQ